MTRRLLALTAAVLIGIVTGQSLDQLVRWAEAACTNTPNLTLCKPAVGDDVLTRYNENFDKLDAPAKMIVTGNGPHAIGSATHASRQVVIGGTTFAGHIGTQIQHVLSPAPNDFGFILNLSGTATINKAASGTHPDFATVRLNPFVMGAGAGSVTNATTLLITGKPTGATNNRALWTQDGDVQFTSAAPLVVLDGVGVTSATIRIRTNGTDRWNVGAPSGSTDLTFSDGTPTERMRLTSGGILALGTTTTTGAGAGQMVFTETTAPSNAGSNGAILFAQDNGSGKTQLCARFATGAVQCFATEP